MNDAVMLEADTQAAAQAAQTTLNRSSALDYEVWLDAILLVARHYRLECSAQTVRLAVQWTEGSVVEDVVRHMARQAGLNCMIVDFSATTLMQRQMPLVVQLDDGQVGVLQTVGDDDDLGITYSGDAGLQSRIARQDLIEHARKILILRPITIKSGACRCAMRMRSSSCYCSKGSRRVYRGSRFCANASTIARSCSALMCSAWRS